jgi:hypothetical protein
MLGIDWYPHLSLEMALQELNTSSAAHLPCQVQRSLPLLEK